MTKHSNDKKQLGVKSDGSPMASSKMRRAKSGWILFQKLFRDKYPKEEYDLDALMKVFPKHKGEDDINHLKTAIWNSIKDSVKDEFKDIAGSEKPPRPPTGEKITQKWSMWREEGKIDEEGEEINGPYEKLMGFIK